MRRKLAASIAAASLLASSAIATVGTSSAAEAVEAAPQTLKIDVTKPIKDVDHAVSGSLYGIGDEGWPPDAWITPTKPKMFTQPPPGATHRPNGEPAPVGDTLDVWPVASRQGATVTVRLPDIFPTFPYQWLGDDYWYEQVERMVRDVQASGADNIYGYEIWNEPQWTWNASWGDYFDMWDRTYRLIRELDPSAKIIGPSYDRDYVRGLRQFMTHTVEAETVPDIVSWHELGPEEGLEVEQHVKHWRSLEREFGVAPLPISINEYGSPRDAGVPGWLIRYMAKLERADVDTANLAFWHKPGRLSDLLVPKGGGSGPATDPEPTGNYWLFDWYGDMSGQMVQVDPSASGRYTEVGEPTEVPATRQPGQAGFGNAIKLNGSEPNRYVEMPSGIVSELTDFTIAGWVNPSVISTWSRIFDFGTGQSTNMFLTPNAGGGMRFAITTSGGGGEQRINSTNTLPTNAWSHVAVTKSGTNGTLWVNGEAVGTQPNLTLSPSDLGETTRNWIGRSQYSDPLLDAVVDDFRIYDRGLTAGEVAGLADGPGDNSAPGLVAAYGFNEDGGNTALDGSGNDVHATVATGTTVERIPSLDGFASADDATDTVRVIFGGGEGDAQLQVDGLTSLDDAFDGKAHVQVYKSEWTGTDGVSEGPVALFEGDHVVKDGSLSLPVDSLVETDAYLAVITPRQKDSFEGPPRRYEAEENALAGDANGYFSSTRAPLASENAYVTPKRGDDRQLRFTVDAPHAGAYDLDVRYTNDAEPVEAGIVVNGQRQDISYATTRSSLPFATQTVQTLLKAGRNVISVDVPSASIGVDYLEITPFRERFEAESGQWSGASQSTVDQSSFFAAYFSNWASVRGLSEPTSNLRLPVTVPAAGRYRLEIGYSTAGTEAERRAQTPAGHILRVDDGPWQDVTYAPTQFRDMIRQTYITVELPAGTSRITLAKGDPTYNDGSPKPGTVDLDYVEVEAVEASTPSSGG